VKLSKFPPVFWALIAAALLNRVGTFVMPFLSFHLTRDHGFTPSQVGLVVSAFGVGLVTSGPIGGLLSDKIGYHRALPVTLLGGALAMVQLGFAQTLPHLELSAAVLGFFGEMYRPAMQSAIADIVDEADRAEAYGILYWAINVGFSVAALTGGLLSAYGFSLLIALDAATTCGFAAIAFFAIRAPRRVSTAEERRSASLLEPLRNAPYMVLVAFGFLITAVFIQHGTSLPLDMQRHGLTAKEFGRLLAANSIGVVVGQPIVNKLVARMAWWRALALSNVLTGVGFGLCAFMSTSWGYLATILVWTTGELFMAPIYPTVVAKIAPAHLRGVYQGILGLGIGMAVLVGPLAGATALEELGAPALWLGCLVVALAAALGNSVLGRLWRAAATRPPASDSRTSRR
jgi:MFS family permease